VRNQKLIPDTALKNADALLHDVLKAVDTSGDGQIQYNGAVAQTCCGRTALSWSGSEFKVFVEHAERELRQLFESIDRDHNGELDKSELKSAFRRAGLAISSAKLDQFFDEVDVNHDGVISFDEWR
jgi:solute carrier family 25 (mitochondrial phosphate transporter), member 23/24/25/41